MQIPRDDIVGEEIVFGANTQQTEYWRDVWRFRGLLAFLVWRDLVVKYKQTAVGLAWVFIKAALNITVLTFLFGKIFRLETNGVPYSLIVITGMILWQFFTTVISDAGNCLEANSSLISKVYFPKVILPLNSLCLCLVDFLVQFTIVIGMLIWYRVSVGWHMLAFPLFVFMTGLIGLSFGMIASSLSVKFRDIKHLIPFLLQLGMYASPVAYLTLVVPDYWKKYYALNPMVGAIDGFRWSLLGELSSPYWPGVIYSACFCLAILYIATATFRKAERGFVDVL